MSLRAVEEKMAKGVGDPTEGAAGSARVRVTPYPEQWVENSLTTQQADLGSSAQRAVKSHSLQMERRTQLSRCVFTAVK